MNEYGYEPHDEPLIESVGAGLGGRLAIHLPWPMTATESSRYLVHLFGLLVVTGLPVVWFVDAELGTAWWGVLALVVWFLAFRYLAAPVCRAIVRPADVTRRRAHLAEEARADLPTGAVHRRFSHVVRGGFADVATSSPLPAHGPHGPRLEKP